MSKERYTVQCLASGQPRPYADSSEVYRVTIEWQKDGHKDPNAPFVPRPELAENYVREILRGLCRGWVDDDKRHGFNRYLQSMKMIEPGVWEVIIIEPYTD